MEERLGHSCFPYLINRYTLTEDYHLNISCNLYFYKVQQAKQANNMYAIPLLLSRGQKILLPIENIHLINNYGKVKPRWFTLFHMQYIMKKENNYNLSLSMDRPLSVIINTFHISKI